MTIPLSSNCGWQEVLGGTSAVKRGFPWGTRAILMQVVACEMQIKDGGVD